MPGVGGWSSLAKDNYGWAFWSHRDMAWPKLFVAVVAAAGIVAFFLPSFGYFCRFSLFLSLYLALVHLASPSRPVVAGNYSMSFCGLRTSDRSERGLWHCYGFSQGAGIRWWKIVSSGRVGGGRWLYLFGSDFRKDEGYSRSDRGWAGRTVTATVDFGAMFCHLPTGI